MAKTEKKEKEAAKVSPIYIEGDKEAKGMIVSTPKNFDDIQVLIRSLREGQSVIFKLDAVDKDTAQRMLDFLSGATFALGGSLKRIEKSMFLATHSGVGVLFQE